MFAACILTSMKSTLEEPLSCMPQSIFLYKTHSTITHTHTRTHTRTHVHLHACKCKHTHSTRTQTHTPPTSNISAHSGLPMPIECCLGGPLAMPASIAPRFWCSSARSAPSLCVLCECVRARVCVCIFIRVLLRRSACNACQKSSAFVVQLC